MVSCDVSSPVVQRGRCENGVITERDGQCVQPQQSPLTERECVVCVVLDEATSQVGVAMERELYLTCARLNITLLSVGHRRSLRPFHHQQLHISDCGRWQLQPIDNDLISIDIDSEQL